MDEVEVVKLAAKLAEPFDTSTFARLSGQSESDAASALGRLAGRGWLEVVSPAGAGGLGGTYRLSAVGRSAAA